jgi:hypothetical protein
MLWGAGDALCVQPQSPMLKANTSKLKAESSKFKDVIDIMVVGSRKSSEQ